MNRYVFKGWMVTVVLYAGSLHASGQGVALIGNGGPAAERFASIVNVYSGPGITTWHEDNYITESLQSVVARLNVAEKIKPKTDKVCAFVDGRVNNGHFEAVDLLRRILDGASLKWVLERQLSRKSLTKNARSKIKGIQELYTYQNQLDPLMKKFNQIWVAPDRAFLDCQKSYAKIFDDWKLSGRNQNDLEELFRKTIGAVMKDVDKQFHEYLQQRVLPGSSLMSFSSNELLSPIGSDCVRGFRKSFYGWLRQLWLFLFFQSVGLGTTEEIIGDNIAGPSSSNSSSIAPPSALTGVDREYEEKISSLIETLKQQIMESFLCSLKLKQEMDNIFFKCGRAIASTEQLKKLHAEAFDNLAKEPLYAEPYYAERQVEMEDSIVHIQEKLVAYSKGGVVDDAQLMALRYQFNKSVASYGASIGPKQYKQFIADNNLSELFEEVLIEACSDDCP